MTKPKPTYDELLERIHHLETQHKSDLRQIAGYEKIAKEGRRGLQGCEILSRHGRDIILFIQRDAARIIDCNEAALKAYGYTRDELLSLKIHDLRAAETLPLVAWQLNEADLSGILFETIHLRKDGSTFPVEVSSVGTEVNGERFILSIVRDISRRKEVEKEFRVSEMRFRKIFEESPVGIAFLDAQRRITNTNQRYREFLGYDEPEIFALGPAGILHPDDWKLSMEMSERLRSGEIPVFRMEQRYIRKDGQVAWSDTHITALRDPDGNIIHTIGWVQDITERKKTEEALRTSELKYRSLFETAEDGIFLLNANGFLDCNESGAHMYGIAKEEVIGHSPLDFSPEYQPDGRLSADVVAGTIAEVLAGKTQKFEWVSRCVDGALFDVEITLSQMGEAGSELLLAIVRDITERKRAEQALKRSQKNLAEAQRQTHIGSFEFDFQTGRLDWSEEMFRIFEVRPEDFQGTSQDFLGRIHPEDLPQIEKRREEGLTAADPLDLDFRIVRPSGEIRFVRMIFETMFDKNGNPFRRIGTFQDVTDWKKAEEERSKLERQLQQAQKMESIGRLAGGMAHDFNNMLAVILGHAEMALGQVDAAQPIYEDLTGIQEAAKRSADLTRQLLAFARKQTIAPEVLDLNETITETLSMLRRMIGENIVLEWQPGANLWPVRMDPSQIDQILANLCVNARDAIADVGRIAIMTDNCNLEAEYCAAHEGTIPGEYVRIAISDTGRGMDKKVLGHIFEPFFTTKEIGQGTGLGLAMVYGAVMQNNGFIDVESEPEVGTTVTIYLPRQMETMQRQLDGAGRSRHCEETVLLVEDEPELLKLVTALLQRQGYIVLAAGTPNQAICLAREHTGEIQLLMTDVIMPEMNGRTLAKILQSMDPNIKCLFMSGYTADVVAHQGVLDEDVCFLQKPFSAKDLADKLSDVLG